jgi:uncharacterized protein (UPF0303 family)
MMRRLRSFLFGCVAAFLASQAMAQSAADKARFEQVQNDEKLLVFDTFDDEAAVRLGMLMVKQAQDTHAPQTVFDIRRNGQILFRAALSGSTPDNERWVSAKIATVSRFLASSERKKLEYQGLMHAGWVKNFPNGGGDAVRFWGLSPEEAMGLVGGGFPINVKGTGFVGTIVASGGPDDTDHDFIVKALRAFLEK